MDEREALRTVDLTKRFGGITALKKVSFDVKYGEVHAIVGQNGAGKSTLVKIINGIHIPDEGSIFTLMENLSRSKAPVMRRCWV